MQCTLFRVSLELYADHMFSLYREIRCDPMCVLGPAVQCTLFPVLLELYADHMFGFHRENRCDLRCFFDVIDECSVHCFLFNGIKCGPFVYNLEKM